jgi:multicomponent Na+:H+ antiporter subunit F
MTAFLIGAAVVVLAASGAGLVRLLSGPSDADRMMAAQLAGTGVAAACLLLSVAGGDGAVADVAVTLGLLAAVAAAALAARPGASEDQEP